MFVVSIVLPVYKLWYHYRPFSQTSDSGVTSIIHSKKSAYRAEVKQLVVWCKKNNLQLTSS